LPQKLSPKEQAFHDRLAKLSGKEFDKVYMSHMVKDHVADVADFQRESSRAKDAEVKDFAQQTLPTLQDHLKEARSVSSSVGNASQAMTSSLMKKK
jgi:putative membrane protein